MDILRKRSWTKFNPPTDFPHHHPTEIISDAEGLRRILNKLRSNSYKTVAIDTETTGLDVLSFKTEDLVSISIADADNAWYVPIHHIDVTTGELEKNQVPVELVKKFLKVLNENFSLVYFNAKYDWKVFKICLGLDMNITWDCLISGWFLDGGVHKTLGLKDRAQRDLGIKMQEISDLIDGAYRTFDTVEIKSASQYAGSDAYLTYKLFQKDSKSLLSYGIQKKAVLAEMKLVKVTAKMEMAGMRIDMDFLNLYQRELYQYQEELYRKLANTVGEINFGSPKQMSELLFDKLKLPTEVSGFSIKQNATGYSTGHRELTTLARSSDISDENRDFLNTLLEYKKVSKTISTMEGWAKRIHPVTGLIHGSFNQIGANTGRYTSSNPNFQNIPSRGWDSGTRRCFVAKDGYEFVEIDFSQAEVRVLAHYSQDENLHKVFYSTGLEGDPHTMTASRIWGIPPEEVTKNQRTLAKQVTFGLPYGISPFGLHIRLVYDFLIDISLEEVEKLVSDYLKIHKGVAKYLEDVKEEVGKTGFITTLTGVRRKFPIVLQKGFGYEHEKKIDRAKRQAVNHPIQGTVAQVVKYGMIEGDELLEEKYPNGEMIIQVHDSIVFHLPKSISRQFVEEFVPIMCNVIPLSVPMEADADFGDNLYQAKGGHDPISELHEHKKNFLETVA